MARYSCHAFCGALRKTSRVAYSSGAKIVHTPPGLRKSGIPLSVEIPAPEKTIMRSDAARICESLFASDMAANLFNFAGFVAVLHKQTAAVTPYL